MDIEVSVINRKTVLPRVEELDKSIETITIPKGVRMRMRRLVIVFSLLGIN